MNTGPKEISEIARAFQVIAGYIERHPERMQADGVFRRASDAQIPPEILQKIKKMKKRETELDKDLERYKEIYSLLDALKLSLRDKILLSPKDPSVIKLKAAIEAVDSREATTVQTGVEAINNFVEELSNSEDLSKKAIAEIIHTYAHLAYIANQYEASNRMSRTNLAVTPLSPFFLNNLSLAADPMDILKMSDKMNACCAELVSVENYRLPYSERGKKEKEHVEKRASGESEGIVKEMKSDLQIEQKRIIELQANMKAIEQEFAQGKVSEAVFHRMHQALKEAIEKHQARVVELTKESALPLKRSSSEEVREVGRHDEQIQIENATIVKLERNIEELQKQFNEGKISADVFQKMQKGLSSDIEKRRAKVEKMAREPDSPPLSASSSRSVSPLSARSADVSPSPTARRQGVLLREPEDEIFEGVLAQQGKVKKAFEELAKQNMSQEKIALLFYKHMHSLNPEQQTQLAEYLCEKDQSVLLNAFMGQVPIMGEDPASALKYFLENSIFRVLKEGQKIERYLDAFSLQYACQNAEVEFMKTIKDIVPESAKQAEAVAVTAVAILMLNTDLHNPRVKDKMSKKEFLNQIKSGFSGIDISVDKLSKDKQKAIEKLAGNIYDYIKKNEIKITEPPPQEKARAAAHDVTAPLSPHEISAAKSAISAVESGRLGSIRRSPSFRQAPSKTTLKEEGGSPEEAANPDKSKRPGRG